MSDRTRIADICGLAAVGSQVTSADPRRPFSIMPLPVLEPDFSFGCHSLPRFGRTIALISDHSLFYLCHELMREAEAPSFTFTRTGKTIVDDHRIIDDRIDPVKALCAIRICNCARSGTS